MRILPKLIVFIFLPTVGFAQQPKWDLKRIIDFAMANNIGVRQSEIQARLSYLTLKQSKLSQIPSLVFSDNLGYSSGRNQDPTTFTLITKGYLSSSMQLQSNVELFNWYSKRNTIAANNYELQASIANVEKQKNDIALVVANAYLQALLAIEQTKIAQIQLQQSQTQLATTRKRVSAGALPALYEAELEAQVARDSAAYIGTQANIELNLLFLKAYMSLDADQPLEIETPAVDKIPVENIADLQPETVFALAVKNLPQQRVNELRFLAAQKNSAAAHGAMMPVVSLFGSLGSNYNNRAQEISGVNYFTVPIGKVSVNGTDYDVLPLQPFSSYTFDKPDYFKQTGENFRQTVGVGVSVPLFNSGIARTNYERSKLNIKTAELQKLQDNQKIKQDIYQAYNAALVALQKLNASKITAQAAERSYEFAVKRFNVGMLSTFELTTSQNNLFTARSQFVLNQFDYIFKMKVLEFYKGMGLKL
ncbi:TolC family protein [soil metagenome]